MSRAAGRTGCRRLHRHGKARDMPALEVPFLQALTICQHDAYVPCHRPAPDRRALLEYGLLIALVAIALIAVVTVFGSNISAWFANKTGQITTV